MECPNCELRQRQFYCENCLKQHLLSFRVQTNHLSTDRDAHVVSAQKALAAVGPARERRAELKGTEQQIQELWDAVDNVRKANEKTRERLRSLKVSLATRRRTLAIASSGSRPPSAPTPSPPQEWTPSPPGSFPTSNPAPQSPVASSPTGRPFLHRRGSSASSVPGSIAVPRPGLSNSRTVYPYTSGSPSGRPNLAAISTSPAVARTASSPVHRYAPSHARAPSDDLSSHISDTTAQLAALSDTLARARAGLVQELVEVFSVVEVGGRPPLGGKAGTRGEWTIGGLVLPVPGDIRRYPPDHINAVLTHTLHFLHLLAFYLGVKLPFEVTWSRSATSPAAGGKGKGQGLLGVGTPWLGAIKGGESGGWARWSAKHPLHVSASPSSPTPSSNPSAPSRPSSHLRSTSTSAVSGSAAVPASAHSRSASNVPSLEDSQLEEPQGAGSSGSAHGNSFTTALAMLLYNVCYLAHTQAVEIPLAQAGEVLGNLWAVCCSPELGRKSHETHPLLPSPTPASFPLDFAQLLQATAANPARPRMRGTAGKEAPRAERIIEEDEGWDLVDAEVD